MTQENEPEFGLPHYPGVRQDIIDAIDRYVEHGIEPGGFLVAVLANDLMQAMGRADHWNRAALFYICSYVYNEIPSTCHGSYDVVRLWCDTRRPAVDEGDRGASKDVAPTPAPERP